MKRSTVRPLGTLSLLVIALLMLLTQTALAGRPDSAGSAQQKISQDVQDILDMAAPEDSVSVIVTLSDQADLKGLGALQRAERLQKVAERLQAKAAAAQKPMLAFLDAKRGEGNPIQVIPFWVFNGMALTANGAVIAELAKRADVLRISADASIPAPSAVTSPVEANVARINAPALWSMGRTGQGAVVASMDTGVNVGHSDLQAQWRGGANSWFDPYNQHPFIPADVNGHGTATTSVMVGRDAGGTAIGVAPDAQWIAVKIFNDQGSATESAIHLGYQWLLDPDGNPSTPDAPHVVNNSWSYSSPGCNLEFQLDLQALRAAGILPVFAAGNFGPNAESSASPANNPEAFAVGATNNEDLIYTGSSRGPSQCGETSTVFPELVAPGVLIKSANQNGLYSYYTGTSLAAPHVSGAAALLLSAFPNLDIAEQERALKSSAVDLGTAGPDGNFGYGRLDVFAAYQYLSAGGPAPTPTPLPTSTPTPVPPTATPTPAPTSAPLAIGVDPVVTGKYVGKGNNRSFLQTSQFSAGEKVVIRAHAVDGSGQPLPGVAVSLVVRQPDGKVVARPAPTTGTDGTAEYAFATGRKSPRGTYTVEVTNAAKSGYTYSPQVNRVSFVVQ